MGGCGWAHVLWARQVGLGSLAAVKRKAEDQALAHLVDLDLLRQL